MSRPEKQYVTDMFDNPERKSPRGGLIAGGLVAVAGIAGIGALVLTSGPEAPRQEAANDTVNDTAVSVVDPSVVAPDAPVYELGVGEDGDWRRGTQTRFVVGNAKSRSEVQIPAADFEPGRYHYDGDLVITGDFAQPYVEITAGSITVTGSINADNVWLNGIEQAAERKEPDFLFMARDTIVVLTGWEHHYKRGDIAVRGSVHGDNINMVAGEISIAGDVTGAVTLSASGGEEADVIITSAHDQVIESLGDWRSDAITPDMYRETVRYPLMKPDEAISITGTVDPAVVQQSTRDLARQIERDAFAARIRERQPAEDGATPPRP